ncbi:MAG: hypothetical protein K2W96_04030 [Gemmataceae bacterium]|nr:hypothetical protein [Gemmataceae bacterium]
MRGPGFGQLSSLDLEDNDLHDLGAETLLSWPRVGQLRHLSLARNPLTERSVAALASCRDLARLRSLDLLGIDGLGAAAVQAPHLSPSLSLRMNLADVPAADVWAGALAKRFRLFEEA